ncbi:MAG: TIGR03086 family metal-binding protein [Acidimicrobiia bacterium]
MDTMQFHQALDEFGRRVERVPADRWASPTPCEDWDVRALVNHIVGELRWMPPILDGKTIAEVGDRFDGDLLGEDPVTTYRSAMSDALEACKRPGVLGNTVHLSFGDVPGTEYLGQVTSDLTIHSWDLARGAGLDARLDRELVGAVYEFMAPQADAWRGAGVFGPPVEVAKDADAQERLLAITGRSPNA